MSGFDPREQARKVVAAKLQEIYGEYITQGSADDWYEDADRLLPLLGRLGRLRPLLDERVSPKRPTRPSPFEPGPQP